MGKSNFNGVKFFFFLIFSSVFTQSSFCLQNMDAIPYHPLLIVTQDDMKKIRQSCGIDDAKRIRDSLDSIELWLKKQPHLAEAGNYMSKLQIELCNHSCLTPLVVLK